MRKARTIIAPTLMAQTIMALALVLLAVMGAPAWAADVPGVIAGDCAQCHQMTAPTAASLEDRLTRTGPPLYFAGNKYRQEWLAGWLQKPTRIHPAGDVPMAHVTNTAEGDVINTASLIDHPVLDSESATAVAAYLMTLKPHDDLIAAESYTPGNVAMRMGAMDFVKFKGCGGCHRDTPNDGGVSGPELYTAWQRLQPEFIVSYIRNPVAWEPYSLMPVKHLQTPQIHKLADYLKTIGEQGDAP